nr:hypothetical protein CFP56_33161 [Quercus suber]
MQPTNSLIATHKNPFTTKITDEQPTSAHPGADEQAAPRRRTQASTNPGAPTNSGADEPRRDDEPRRRRTARRTQQHRRRGVTNPGADSDQHARVRFGFEG